MAVWMLVLRVPLVAVGLLRSQGLQAALPSLPLLAGCCDRGAQSPKAASVVMLTPLWRMVAPQAPPCAPLLLLLLLPLVVVALQPLHAVVLLQPDMHAAV
jgi:hypothetical protein